MSEEKISEQELFPENFDFEIPNGFWVKEEMWKLERWPFYREKNTLFYKNQEVYIHYDGDPFTLPGQIKEFQEKIIEFLAQEKGWQWLVYVVLEQYGVSEEHEKSNYSVQLERIKVLPKDFKIVEASEATEIINDSSEFYLLQYKGRGIKIFSEDNFKDRDFSWFPMIIVKTLSALMGPDWLISNIIEHQNSK